MNNKEHLKIAKSIIKRDVEIYADQIYHKLTDLDDPDRCSSREDELITEEGYFPFEKHRTYKSKSLTFVKCVPSRFQHADHNHDFLYYFKPESDFIYNEDSYFEVDLSIHFIGKTYRVVINDMNTPDDKELKLVIK